VLQFGDLLAQLARNHPGTNTQTGSNQQKQGESQQQQPKLIHNPSLLIPWWRLMSARRFD
jgi:hypothetical protein